MAFLKKKSLPVQFSFLSSSLVEVFSDVRLGIGRRRASWNRIRNRIRLMIVAVVIVVAGLSFDSRVDDSLQRLCSRSDDERIVLRNRLLNGLFQ